MPGTGKSSIARDLACQLCAVWLRIDSIEQAIRDSGILSGPLDDAGYRAAYAVAEDNLRVGLTVIADCVNPWMATRDAWRDAGLRAGVRVVEIETVCWDKDEHRRRVQMRSSEFPGLSLPDWQSVISRDYHDWDRDRIVLETAGRSIAECVRLIVAELRAAG